jgi:hypothetical protein
MSYRGRGRGYQLKDFSEEETVDSPIDKMEESEEETTQSIFTSTPPRVNKKRATQDTSNISEQDQTRLEFSDQQV